MEKEYVDSCFLEENYLLGVVINILFKLFENYVVEENLKISEEKFCLFFENIMDVYFMFIMEGNLYEVSLLIFNYLGYI